MHCCNVVFVAGAINFNLISGSYYHLRKTTIMKLIFTFLIVYWAYLILFKQKKIQSPPGKKHLSKRKNENEGEYVDYEEVE